MWTGTTLSLLTPLPGGAFSHGYGVSEDGQTIVGVSDSSTSTPGTRVGEACRWQGGVAASLGDLPGGARNGVAWSCTADGSVIVGESVSSAGTEAFHWTQATGMRRMQDMLASDYGIATPGWRLVRARAITPSGSVIVGEGINPAGAAEGWVFRTGGPLTSTFCAGDGTVAACPCSNTGSAGHGCASSGFPGGALLSGLGAPSLVADSFVLDATSMTGSTCVFFQGSLPMAPVIVDDGLGCVTGSVIRLGTKSVVAAASSFPQPGDPLISIRGAIPPTVTTRYYQCFYRNAAAAFCPPATSNRTNGVIATWVP